MGGGWWWSSTEGRGCSKHLEGQFEAETDIGGRWEITAKGKSSHAGNGSAPVD